ncbi:hypothetical protein V1525DRAFT_398631 [Lipomyces kononenkoae]|uniref:Uncharacterized protein n=1 Tax=Lipomyces kononenkoae TaxID=34357 RepID=A0ACC3T630_LIPKO
MVQELPSAEMTTFSDNFSDREFLEYTGSESGLASQTTDMSIDGNCDGESVESWILASMIALSDDDNGTDNENDNDYVESESSRAFYSPAVLAQSFKNLGIHEQVVHQRAVIKKLNHQEAAFLYAFAAFFCLNGPVGFRTKVRLDFECKGFPGIKHKGKVSLRDVFGSRITHPEFAQFVSAVKKSLPEGIACPMTKNYGEYFPNLAFTLTHLGASYSPTSTHQRERLIPTDADPGEISPMLLPDSTPT